MQGDISKGREFPGGLRPPPGSAAEERSDEAAEPGGGRADFPVPGRDSPDWIANQVSSLSTEGRGTG